MLDAPKGLRLHIGLFGRRNVGKSSLLNALAAQSVSIVSDTPGTTTDPVEKTLEFAPLGPVVFLDTAGLDDEGELGTQRTERTLAVLPRTVYQAKNGQKTCTGILAGYEDGAVTLTMGEDTVTFPKQEIAFVRLHVGF